MAKRTHHGFGILEIIIIVVVVGIIITLAWVLFFKKQGAPNQPETKPEVTQQSQLKPQDVTKRIKESLAETYTLVDFEKNNQPKDKELSVRTEEASPPYKVDGYDYHVTYDGGSALTIISQTASPTIETTAPLKKDAEVRRKVEKVYHDLGLESIESQPDVSGGLRNIFIGNGLICTIDAQSSISNNSVSICGTLSEYPAVAAAMKPFSEVLEHTDSETVLSGTVKSSKSGDYQIATISVGNIREAGGSVAVLWKQGVGNWTLFRYTQNIIPCSAFNTTSLRNAFEGEQCSDEQGQESFVTRENAS